MRRTVSLRGFTHCIVNTCPSLFLLFLSPFHFGAREDGLVAVAAVAGSTGAGAWCRDVPLGGICPGCDV